MDIAKKSSPKSCKNNARSVLRATNRESHIIVKSGGVRNVESKAKPPVIKVVHIFNPTVIKTDAANFRSLVQKLTGRSCMPLKLPVSHGYGAKSKTGFSSLNPVSFYDGQFKQLQSSTNGIFTHASSNQIFGYFPPAQKKELPMSNMGLPQGSGNSETLYPANPGSSERIKMYIPERLGSFSDLDIISGLVSSEPLPDCNILPPLSEDTMDQLLPPTPRVCGFYDSFETIRDQFSLTY